MTEPAQTGGNSVYIFQSWPRTPTYHDYGGIRDRGTADSADVTRCGLVMYDRETRYSARLRRDHADLFAKPCAKCFPDGRDD